MNEVPEGSCCVEYGIESEAVRINGQYHDGIHMTLKNA